MPAALTGQRPGGASGRPCRRARRRTIQRRTGDRTRWARRDPVVAPRKTPIAVGPATYGSMPPSTAVDDRAGDGRDADHQVAGRGRDAQRHAHRQVHQRHLDDPAADAEERRDRRRRTTEPAMPSGRRCDPVARARQGVEERPVDRRPRVRTVGRPSIARRPTARDRPRVWTARGAGHRDGDDRSRSARTGPRSAARRAGTRSSRRRARRRP